MIYRGIKVLSNFGIVLSGICILLIPVNSEFIFACTDRVGFDEVFVYILINQLALPILALIVSIALRCLYNELSSDKVSTVTMMTDLQKELDGIRQELTEVKEELKQLKSK